jgi:voltage-gated potassium channel
VLASVPRILFPQRQDPLRALARRIATALGVLLFVALVTWLGRGGYRDADGNALSLLDAVYYASVTLTTTGYGDITPVTPTARAVTAFVVTPARILFLIVLVGTTLEVLTERFRQSLAESRWRNRVTDHIIVVGYGTKGRGAVDSLLASGETTPDHVVVIDTAALALEEARTAGFTAVHGDATRIAVLGHARVEEARALIVTCDRDDTATLITLTARELNPRLKIAAAVHEAENAHLLKQSGADTVIVSAEAAGRLLGLATGHPAAVAVFEDLLESGQGIQMTERPVTSDEVGGAPLVLDGKLPIALVRQGVRIPFDAEGFDRTEADDTVVCVHRVGGAAGAGWMPVTRAGA